MPKAYLPCINDIYQLSLTNGIQSFKPIVIIIVIFSTRKQPNHFSIITFNFSHSSCSMLSDVIYLMSITHILTITDIKYAKQDNIYINLQC